MYSAKQSYTTQTVAKPKSADNMPVYFGAHIHTAHTSERLCICVCVKISPIFPFYQKLMSCINYSVALETLPYKHFWQIEIDAVQVDRRSVTSWLSGGWKLFVCMVLDTRAWALYVWNDDDGNSDNDDDRWQWLSGWLWSWSWWCRGRGRGRQEWTPSHLDVYVEKVTWCT